MRRGQREVHCANSSKIPVMLLFYFAWKILIGHRGGNILSPRDYAWETIYFPPCAQLESSRQSKKATSLESLKNLHNGLHAALSSFHDTCQIAEGIKWDSLPYAGRNWKVRMKFAIAYVIGDRLKTVSRPVTTPVATLIYASFYRATINPDFPITSRTHLF